MRQESKGLLTRTKATLPFLALAVCFAVLYRDVIALLIEVWSEDANYSHGFLIVPLAIYFASCRLQEFRRIPSKPNALGLVVVLFSIGLLLAGLMGAEVFATNISIIGTVAGSVLFLYGWQRLKVMMFPIAFLLLMVPIPKFVFNQIAIPLQFVASSFAEQAMTFLHIPVLREGNIIHLANISLEVEEACSGIRSVVSLLTMGIVYGYFMEPRPRMRFVLCLVTMPVAIFANALRVAITGITAYKIGPETAEGFFHAFSGWFLFAVAGTMLIVIHHSFSLMSFRREGIS